LRRKREAGETDTSSEISLSSTWIEPSFTTSFGGISSSSRTSKDVERGERERETPRLRSHFLKTWIEPSFKTSLGDLILFEHFGGHEERRNRHFV
jgi:hypothetical protein